MLVSQAGPPLQEQLCVIAVGLDQARPPVTPDLHTSPAAQNRPPHLHTPLESQPFTSAVGLSVQALSCLQPQVMGAGLAGLQTSEVPLVAAQPAPQPAQLALLVSASQPLSGIGDGRLPAAGIVQFTFPSWHVEVQTPLLHSRDMTPLFEHCRLQRPQWSTLVSTRVSQPAALGLQSSQPLSHLNPHTPAEQLGIVCGGVGHWLLQVPQWFGSFCGFTHWPPQLTSGAVQVVTHWPAWHTLPPEQALPQAPQLLLSIWVLTQAVPHLV